MNTNKREPRNQKKLLASIRVHSRLMAGEVTNGAA